MAQQITIQYDLHPPQDTPATTLSSSKTHEFPVNNAGTSAKEHYEGLRQAIAQARTTVGDELTAWRDVVGNREQVKDAKKDEDDADEEEEE